MIHTEYDLSRDEPHTVFGTIAKLLEWDVCEEFCKVFNINFAMCIEFTGDELLRAGETRSALQCYNVARVRVICIIEIYVIINGLVDTICENRSEVGHVRREQCSYAFVRNGPENVVRPEEHASA